jgi:hypothetical protein
LPEELKIYREKLKRETIGSKITTSEAKTR